jgi:pilus assembly protein CpaB
VNDIVGVAGFVIPGMRVDLIIMGNPITGGGQGTVARTILQNIQVLSAGTNIQKDNEGKPVQVPVVNLLVTPEQAEELSLASNETRIQLVLRNPLDNDTTKTPGFAVAGLFSNQPAAPKVERAVVRQPVAPPPVVVAQKAPEPPHVYLVNVMNGSKVSQEKFTAPDGQAK